MHLVTCHDKNAACMCSKVTNGRAVALELRRWRSVLCRRKEIVRTFTPDIHAFIIDCQAFECQHEVRT